MENKFMLSPEKQETRGGRKVREMFYRKKKIMSKLIKLGEEVTR